jgi:hypothetical protein
LNLAGMTIASQTLTGSYVASAKAFSFSGAADLSYGAILSNVPVQLAGITVQNGVFTSLTGAITSSFTIAGATIQPQSLGILYQSTLHDYVVYGSATLRFGAESFPASFGTMPAPGVINPDNLVLGAGVVQAMNIGLTGSLTIMGFAAQSVSLAATYDALAKQLALGGTVSINLASDIPANLTLSRDGLEIDPLTGALEVNAANGLSLSGDVALGQFKAVDLALNWAETNGQLTMTAGAKVVFPGNFLAPATLVLSQNQLTGITFNSTGLAIPLGRSGLYISAINGQLNSLSNLTQIAFAGAATIVSHATITLQNHATAVLSVTGQVTATATDFQVNGSLAWLSGVLGKSAGTDTLDLQWSTGLCEVEGTETFFGNIFTTSDSVVFNANGDIAVKGSADVTLPPGLLPGIYQLLNASPGQTVNNMNFYLQILTGPILGNTFAEAFTTVVLTHVFIAVPLGGKPTASASLTATFSSSLQKSFQAVVATTAAQLRAGGDSSAEAAAALQGAYNLAAAAVVQALDSAGYSFAAIGAALSTVFSATDAEAALILQQAGFAASDAAQVLSQGFQDSTSQVAKNLAQAGFSINSVAVALHGLGASATDAFAALQQAYAASVQTVVDALLSSGGYLAVEVALVLDTVENETAVATAQALATAGVAGTQVALIVDCLYELGVPQTAAVLAQLSGYNSVMVAQALQGAFGLGAPDLPATLKSAGYSSTDIALTLKTLFKTQAQTLAQYLEQSGFSSTDTATALQAEYKVLQQQAAQMLAQARYQIGDVATALQIAYKEQQLQAMAATLQQAGFHNTDIGTLLHKQYNQQASQMAQILVANKAKGDDITSVLTSSYGLDADGIAGVLKPWYIPGSLGQLLQHAGFNAQDISTAMGSVLGQNAGQVAGIFFDFLTFPIDESAAAIGAAFKLGDSAVGAVMHAVGFATSALQSLGSDFVSAFNSVKNWFDSTF